MIWMAVVLSAFVVAAGLPVAGELEFGDEIVTRSDSLAAVLKLPEPIEGRGLLRLTWTDSYGRTVAVEERAVEFSGGEVRFALELARAVALQNFLEAELAAGEVVVRAPKKEFFVTPEYERWDDYQIIMYYHYALEVQDALRDVGITAGKISGRETRLADGAAAWYGYNYRFYCDQISTFFYAAYHTPAYKPKNKMYTLAKEAYAKDRTSKKPFYRRPCFHDEEALADAVGRLRAAVRTQKRFKPYFYAHCDEAGVADLVAPWDFCFDPRTLAAMREWLVEQYGSLAAINEQWGTQFGSLEEVVPFSTDEMMARGDDNFSPWADHRFFMNRTFADVLAAGTEAVAEEDPTAFVGLVGCQMPSAFGGYDYWLLSRVMKCIEPYNIGNNREVWRSLVPDKPAVTTAFGFGDREIWRLWYQMLHGDLGIIIYDEEYRYLTEDGKPTELGASVAPTYKELTGGIRKQLAHMKRVEDPIAIHYSQPSITAHWMYETRPLGQDWVTRESWHDRQSSAFLRLREACVKVIEDNLLQYDFVAYGQLDNGEFDDMDYSVMILPQSIAMSKAECEAIRRFVRRGGTLIADCRTALMDEHCRALGKGQLDDLFGIERGNSDFAPGPAGLEPTGAEAPAWVPRVGLSQVSAAEPGVRPVGGAVAYYRDAKGTPAVIVNEHGKGRAIYLNAVITDYHRWRLRPPEGEGLRGFMAALFAAAGVAPQYAITAGDGRFPVGVEVHPYECGNLRILALHRNYQLRVKELGPPEYHSQAALEGEMNLSVDFGSPCAVYDQRAGKFLGRERTVTVPLPEFEPVILAALSAPAEGLEITAPPTAAPGDLVAAKLKLKGPRPADFHTFRVRVIAPDGGELRMLTANLAAPEGQATWRIPFAASDAPGRYTLRVRDMMTGLEAAHELTLGGPGAR